jgi:hypothetical protein
VKGSAERIECGRWRLDLELPDALGDRREDLVSQVIALAGEGAVVPLRRSRHAVTYKARFRALAEEPGDVFIKVIDRPRGMDRIKSLIRGSAATRLRRITAQLTAAGFGAPPLWVRGYDRSSGREVIVTPRAEGTGPLRTLIAVGGDPVRKRALLRGLGAEIARLHRAAFVHGDLTPFNIFIVNGTRPRFVLLDHERTRRSFLIGRRRRNLRNLVQLGRFSLPGLSRSDRLRVMQAYAAAMGSRDLRGMTRRVAKMLEARLARDGGAETIAPLQPVKL